MIAAGVLTAVGGGLLASIVNGIFARSRNVAEAESTRATAVQIATDTTLSVITDLRDEIVRLKRRLDVTEVENEEARRRVDDAEAHAGKAEYDLKVLRCGVTAYQHRVEYLTRLLEESGVNMTTWVPPDDKDEHGRESGID
jgi:hypothetical protein